MPALNRRYDIDWVRVIAIGLLLVYHVAITFQPWGIMIGFISNDTSWGSLWTPMTMLNVWRIPLLFYISGMGVYFALQNRNWKQLLRERTGRILVPFIFGALVIVPIHVYLWQRYYAMGTGYRPDPGHLWFLGNIFIYIVIMLPLLFFLKKHENGCFARWLKSMFRTPLGLLPIFAAFVAEVLIIDPRPYELYAMTWHGFFLGLVAFISGFLFVFSGEIFWNMLLRWRWLFIAAAVALYVSRVTYFNFNAPGFLLALESNCWILSIFAFGHRYLNRPGRVLQYLSAAAYPVYIMHMIFLYLGAVLLFPLSIVAPAKFTLVLLFTTAGCFMFYELVVRRIKLARILFGLQAK